jgi:hypothetical protein
MKGILPLLDAVSRNSRMVTFVVWEQSRLRLPAPNNNAPQIELAHRKFSTNISSLTRREYSEIQPNHRIDTKIKQNHTNDRQFEYNSRFSVRKVRLSVRTDHFSVHTDCFSVQTNCVSVRTNCLLVCTDCLSVRTDWLSVRTDCLSVHTDSLFGTYRFPFGMH